MKVTPNRNVKGWFDVFDGDGWHIGTWKTPKQARHKARMWYLYMTLGDERFLHE